MLKIVVFVSGGRLSFVSALLKSFSYGNSNQNLTCKLIQFANIMARHVINIEAWCSRDNMVEVVVPGTHSSISLANEVRTNNKRGFQMDILPR